MKEIPPMNRIPRNLSDGVYIVSEGYEVAAYTPNKDGKGRPTEVHLILDLEKSMGGNIVMRIKSAEELDRMIEVLKIYRNQVWLTK